MAEENRNKGSEGKKRVLGDEWKGWEGDIYEKDTGENKRTFLLLSLVILASLILLAFLFLYLVLPRFELFGRFWAVVITGAVIAIAVSLVIWYALLVLKVIFKNCYLNVCLGRSNRLFYFLLPYAYKLASVLGISRDRIAHSFILVNNRLTPPPVKQGSILALLPRCLRKDVMKSVKEICDRYPDVVYHVAPGGTVARKIVKDVSPSSIVAVACERDLLSGIKDLTGKIPVIGIPNKRPHGPCKDTVIELEELRAALDFFQNHPSS